MTSSFTEKLMHWYAENARELPWRDHPDPYAIWISEKGVLTCRTRICDIPCFLKELEHFSRNPGPVDQGRERLCQLVEGGSRDSLAVVYEGSSDRGMVDDQQGFVGHLVARVSHAALACFLDGFEGL